MGKRSSEPTSRDYILGLDLGETSIGWAVMDERDGKPSGIRRAGVRRFDAGVEGNIQTGQDEPPTTQRRTARQQRRQQWRRVWRQTKLFRILQKAGLLPPEVGDSPEERHKLLTKLDGRLRRANNEGADRVQHHLLPYLLRAKALDDRLEPYELGRALYHLAQRRGYQSNRKAAKDTEDAGIVEGGIGELEDAIKASGARTLGEHFAGLDPEEERLRGRYTSRTMYKFEFEQIWRVQSPHHKILTDDLKDQIHRAIFFQRPLKSQKGLIGRCDLEPAKRRAPAACMPSQELRLLQKVNDLQIITSDGEICGLEPSQREVLITALERGGDVTFGKIRKLLALKKPKGKASGYTFNLEEGGEKKLVGNRTGAKLAELLGDWWAAR